MIVMLSGLGIQLRGEMLAHYQQGPGFNLLDHKGRPTKTSHQLSLVLYGCKSGQPYKIYQLHLPHNYSKEDTTSDILVR